MLKVFMTAAFLAVTPIAAFAHGAPPAAAHGGQVAEDSAEHWVELVIKADQLTVYVLGEDKNSVSSNQLTGKATLLVGGKSQQVVLAPGEESSLMGKLDSAGSGKIIAVLSLTVAGKPTQARFASVQP